MDWKDIVPFVAAAFAGIGVLLGITKLIRDAKREAPVIQIDQHLMSWAGTPKVGDVPRSMEIKITNVGGGLAKDVRVDAWLLMAGGDRFVVPPDERLGGPHYAGHVKAIKSGDTMQITAFRSGEAYTSKRIPAFDPTFVPVTKVRVEYRSQFYRRYTERDVRAGKPEGWDIGGVDSRPLDA